MSKQKYNAFRYYEGICSTKNIIPELAKVLSLGVRSKAVKNSDGDVLESPKVLMSSNWDIVYPAPDANFVISNDPETEEYQNMSPSDYVKKINNQVSQISDTVILRTTIKSDEISDEDIDENLSSEDIVDDLTMYLEIYKPSYICNPEQYTLDCERQGVIPELITEKIYEDALATIITKEHVITTESINTDTEKKVVVADTSTEGSNSKNFSTTDASAHVAAICNIVDEDKLATSGFSVPDATSPVSSITLNAGEILTIKSKNAELYNKLIKYVLDTLSDSDIKKINTINIILNYNDTADDSEKYTFILAYTILKSQYTIEAETSFDVDKLFKDELFNRDGTQKAIITTQVLPYHKKNGIYTPVDEAYWEYDPTSSNNHGIIFKEKITGNTVDNGEIVFKYNITKDVTENIANRAIVPNNHYILMRMFDDLNETKDGPSESIYDSNGDVITQRAHISDWCKFAWYKDFEEIYRDDIDTDVSVDNIADGTLLVPLITAGLNSETKVRYWINTNNNRFNLVIMGNPSLDIERERHLVSACYCGKIDSFDYSISDVAGNFALFTSSSTEPCNSRIEINKIKSATTIDNTDFVQPCRGDETSYPFSIEEGKFFDDGDYRYTIKDKDGNIVEGAENQTFKSMDTTAGDVGVFTLQDIHKYDSTYTLYVMYPYYVEDKIFTPGVERDMFGNVINVEKTNTWGKNTSDGTTSVMMYHTRSKAYYQKHHMMFTTTEEYMSKVMYGKSSYTNEYYADRIKITHSNDGPRGMLNDMIVIDSHSLYPLDELVINKDFAKEPEEYEETYIYFPITAPYSPLSDSPNATYGIAIKKAEVPPVFADENKTVDFAIDELKLLANDLWNNITEDIVPPNGIDVGTQRCSILWELEQNSKWYDNPNLTGTDKYCGLQLNIIQDSSIDGDNDTELTANNISSVNADSAFDGDKKISKIVYNVGELTDGQEIYYGVSSENVVVYDHAVVELEVEAPNNSDENKEGYHEGNYKYYVDKVPCCGKTTTSGSQTLTLINAKPGDYLYIYKAEVDEDTTKHVVTEYSKHQLTKEEINYPSDVIVKIVSGTGKVTEPSSSFATVLYNQSLTVKVSTSETVLDVKSKIGDTTPTTLDVSPTSITGGYEIAIPNIVDDCEIQISLGMATP